MVCMKKFVRGLETNFFDSPSGGVGVFVVLKPGVEMRAVFVPEGNGLEVYVRF